jgi:hypothetical protein
LDVDAVRIVILLETRIQRYPAVALDIFCCS